MKAIIGVFFKSLNRASAHAEKMKKRWLGKICFVVVGNEKNGYMVISERSARKCGIYITFKSRRYESKKHSTKG